MNISIYLIFKFEYVNLNTQYLNKYRVPTQPGNTGKQEGSKDGWKQRPVIRQEKK